MAPRPLPCRTPAIPGAITAFRSRRRPGQRADLRSWLLGRHRAPDDRPPRRSQPLIPILLGWGPWFWHPQQLRPSAFAISRRSFLEHQPIIAVAIIGAPLLPE